MKRFTTYFILISFVALLVPREWIHECDHSHHVELQSDEDAEVNSDDCFACDYSFNSLNDGNHSIQISSIVVSKKELAEFKEPVRDKGFSFFLLRGPPQG